MGNLKRFIHFQCYNLAYFKWQNIFNERNKICANYTDDTAQMSKYEFRTCDHVCVCVYVMFQYVLMRQSWTILWPCEAGGLVANSVRLLWPHGLYPPGSSDMEFPKQEYWSGLPFHSSFIFCNTFFSLFCIIWVLFLSIPVIVSNRNFACVLVYGILWWNCNFGQM